MKYGLLYYKDTNNIADDIQAYAASQFLPRIDYLIDREALEDFIPDKKEKVKVIMNAWYLHDKFNFDISPYIYPLYVSIFLKKFPYEGGITVGTDYINKNVKNNFIKYGAVGTRDLHTQRILNSLNIDNYFSGCLTLTIEKFKNINRGDYIVTVGLNNEEIDFIKSKTNRDVKNIIQDVELGKFHDESWEERKARVEDILKIYQGAHMVVTTKLHCSLPCLALETPVLLLYDTSFPENEDRIGTYLEYLNYVPREEFKNSKIDFENSLSNSEKYLDLRKNLRKTCNDFINNDIFKNTVLPNISDYKEYLIKSKNMRALLITLLGKLQKTYEYECSKSDKINKENNILSERIEILERTIEDMNTNNQYFENEIQKKEEQLLETKAELVQIKNSRSWKILCKIKKIFKR